MKNGILLFPFLQILPWLLMAQSPFVRVTDNPAATFANTPAPYKSVAWIDLDDDNRTDLFVAPRFLFHNDGNGIFSQLGSLPDVVGPQLAAGSSWADVDNDGDPDCITTNKVSQFYRNTPSGFQVASAELPADFAGYSAWDAALGDADNDGRLDMVFVHAENFHPTGPYTCRFYRQESAGSFSSMTGYEFTDALGPYTVPVWSDYDLDGDVDLFVASGPAGTPGQDFNYQNQTSPGGVFGLQRLLADPFGLPQDGQTYNFVDYDNDGDLDVCLTNYGGAPNRFYRNNGNGVYAALTTPFTITAPHLANAWGDIDNDGDLDVLITRDAVNTIALYRNNGNGGFEALTVAGTTDAPPSGLALADYDNDGDLDFYVNGAGEARALFRNELAVGTRHWIAFRLYGVASNASALGARVRVKATIGGQAVWQQREVSAHNSFMSQNDLRVHVGLDAATTIDSLEVYWPSGQIDIATGLIADNFYRVTEGAGIEVISPVAEPTSQVRLEISPNPIGEAFRIIGGASLERVELFDTAGRAVPIEWTSEIDGASVRVLRELPFATYFVRAYWPGGVGVAAVVAF